MASNYAGRHNQVRGRSLLISWPGWDLSSIVESHASDVAGTSTGADDVVRRASYDPKGVGYDLSAQEGFVCGAGGL